MTIDRLPPQSSRELRYLVRLHGLDRVRAALSEIEQAERQITRVIGVIQVEDVGRLMGGFGRVLARDVGKRIYRSHGVVQFENDEQRDARVSETARRRQRIDERIASRLQS